jgi:outer membrane protein OmpA-like peptidoglycan-associated protein
MSRATKTLTAILSFAAIGAFGAGPASAQDKNVTEDQILRALAPEKRPLTRGLSVGPQQATADPAASAAEGKLVQKYRGRSSRSLSATEREEIAAVVKDKPKIDLEINFDYNSAAVSAQAEPQLHSLGKALTSAELAGSVFMLGGHTDAKGSDGYNQNLSERRAETVKKFLMETYKIPAENLVSAGYGETDLKNKADPAAAENRRVQIVNMAKHETASK